MTVNDLMKEYNQARDAKLRSNEWRQFVSLAEYVVTVVIPRERSEAYKEGMQDEIHVRSEES